MKEVGRTELIDDSPNPQFVKHIEMLFKFEERQKMVLEVYDADDKGNLLRLDRQELVGEGQSVKNRKDYFLPARTGESQGPDPGEAD